MKLNCVGRTIEELAIYFNVPVPNYPESCYTQYSTVDELRNTLKEIGLIVRYPNKGEDSFFLVF